jgi:hypothetical protein
MMIQVKKTYRGLNPEMLYDEVRDLVTKRGLSLAEATIQTYSVSSGATQSRVTVPVSIGGGQVCGSLHIVGSSNGDARMTLELDDSVVTSEAVSELQADIDFMLGTYEVKW